MDHMFNRNHQDKYDTAQEADDRDLIALANEARDPGQLDLVTKMARHRDRARRQDTRSRATRPSRSRGARLALGRALSLRS
jgi:hypothetical protein